MPDGSALCLRCGLCCDGTVHAHVPLLREDAEAARRVGLAVHGVGADLHFTLPCPRLADRCCTVYADRPAACRRYRCAVLAKYEDGRLSLADAETHVTRAEQLRHVVVATSPVGSDPAVIWRAIADESAGEGPMATVASRRTHVDWLLAVARLRRYIHRHFIHAR
jgi:Fe-S-cluster containining protein